MTRGTVVFCSAGHGVAQDVALVWYEVFARIGRASIRLIHVDAEEMARDGNFNMCCVGVYVGHRVKVLSD